MRMKKRIVKPLVLACLMGAVCAWPLALVGRAVQPCAVSFGVSGATQGNLFTVDVDVKGNVGAATLWLSYDMDRVMFLAASGENSFGGDGTVVLDFESDDQESTSFEMTFLALKPGNTQISCERYDIVDGDGTALAVSVEDCPVSVKSPCAGEHTYQDGVCTQCGDCVGQVIAGSVDSIAQGCTITLLPHTRQDVVEQPVLGSGTYYFSEIPAGSYDMKVEKTGYVTRQYPVEVEQSLVVQNVVVHKLGDLNGDDKINTLDVSQVNAWVKQMLTCTEYQQLCADANGDGRINTMDVSVLNAYVKGVIPLS